MFPKWTWGRIPEAANILIQNCCILVVTNLTRRLHKHGPKMRRTITVKGIRRGENQVMEEKADFTVFQIELAVGLLFPKL